MRSIFWRIVLLAAFTALAIVLFLPSTPISKRLPSFWVDGIPKINLGLDLQGGMHLVLSVDQDKAVESHTQRLAGSMEDTLKRKGIPFYNVSRQGIDSIAVSYPDEKSRGEIEKTVSDDLGVFGSPTAGNGALVFKLDAEESKRIRDWAISQALETIRNRIDKFGVAEPIIQKQGENELVGQLPGLKDPERAIG